MLSECDQIHDNVASQAERSNNSEKDPKHELVGTGDSITLRVDENHDHLVEEHLNVADGYEEEIPQSKKHERDQKHG